MLQSALQLVALRRLSWSCFQFPRWQAWLMVAFLATLAGLNPDMRVELFGTQDVTVLAWGVVMAYTWTVSLLTALIGIGFLEWWMQRGGRWDQQGELFNLLVAARLVMDLLLFCGWAAEIPPLGMLPVQLYALWVLCHALSGVIPKASRAYCLGGLLLAEILQLSVGFRLWGLTKIAVSVPPWSSYLL